MAEAPTTAAARTGAPPQEPQAVTTAVDLTVPFAGLTAEITADTFVCTGTLTQFPPPTEAQAADLPFGLTYTVSGPAASTIAAEPVQISLAGSAGVTADGDLVVLPNGTVALDVPHLATTTVGPELTVPLTTYPPAVGLTWEGYAGAAETGLGTLVHEPGTGWAVGVDAGGSAFIVPADSRLVSSPGTIRTHLLSAALSDFDPPPWDPDLVMTHQHAEWKLGEVELVEQGLSDAYRLAALDIDLTERLSFALTATALSDEEKQRTLDQHLANLNLLVAIAKPAVSAVGPPVIQVRQEEPRPKPGATVTQEAPKPTPPAHAAMTMWDKLCDAFWTLLAVLPSAWIGKILGKILGGIRGAIKTGQGAEAAKAAASAAKNAANAAKAAGATEAAARAEAAAARAAEAAANAERAAGEARAARDAANAAAHEGRQQAYVDQLSNNAKALENQSAANEATARAAAENAAKETEAAVDAATKASSSLWDLAAGVAGFVGEVTSIGAASRLGENLADAIDELTK